MAEQMEVQPVPQATEPAMDAVPAKADAQPLLAPTIPTATADLESNAEQTAAPATKTCCYGAALKKCQEYGFFRGRRPTVDRPTELRWMGLLALMTYYLIGKPSGFYIITYFWAILLIALRNKYVLAKIELLQPTVKEEAPVVSEKQAAAIQDLKIDPEKQDLEAQEPKKPEPTKPSIKELEYRYWKISTIATAVACICTRFPIFDIPVFWPILAGYVCFAVISPIRLQWRYHELKKAAVAVAA